MTNDLVTAVWLWRELEHTRLLLQNENKRFCVRNIIGNWQQKGILDWQHAQLDLPNCKVRTLHSYDEYLWEVCRMCECGGWEVLPPPDVAPEKSLALLRVLMAKEMRVGLKNVSYQMLEQVASSKYQMAGNKYQISK